MRSHSPAVVVDDNADMAVYLRRSLMTGENADPLPYALAKTPVLKFGTSRNVQTPKNLYALGFPAGIEFGDTLTATQRRRKHRGS